MAHIELPELPGIAALLTYRPDTGMLLNQLADVLLRGESPLSPGERELMAAYVSALNECQFCRASHGAVARQFLEDGENENVVEAAICDVDNAPISEKLKALLHVAAKVQMDGKQVNAEDIQRAKAAGACDRSIHDTVLVASAFCMYNRYVDGLGTHLPPDATMFDRAARQIAEVGYRNNWV
ncbi:MAG: carboxymuconolactone decarboxylase family protein [Cyanobacteria bacterium SID2]|nr:carboxymuconolactone decarboxylase family protein [Cyanobacteria bacterium SID2]